MGSVFIKAYLPVSTRKIDAVILSDLHLGHSACHAKEIINYLQSVHCETLIINGHLLEPGKDPKELSGSHQFVLAEILAMSEQGTKIYILEEDGLAAKSLRDIFPVVQDRLELLLFGKRYLIFPGNKLAMMARMPLVARGFVKHGYHFLIRINKLLNYRRLGQGRTYQNYAAVMRKKFSYVVKFIHGFQKLAFQEAFNNQAEIIVCALTHTPTINELNLSDQHIKYMNAGDWVENLTALECRKGNWTIYDYKEDYLPEFPTLFQKEKTNESFNLFQSGNKSLIQA